MVLGGDDATPGPGRDGDARRCFGAVRAQHARGTEVAAAVARHHEVAGLDLLDRALRAVTHRDAGALDETLILIADHHDVAVLLGEHPHQLPLRDVGVLELVDQDVPEAAAPPLPGVEVVAEQVHRLHQEVVEIERGGLEQAALVLAVHVGDALLGRGEGPVDGLLPRHQLVLHRRDRRVQAPGREPLRVHVEVAPHVVDQAHGVGLVVDREGRPVPEHRCFAPQDARAHGVERRHPHALRDRPDELRHARLHLARGLVGERDRGEAERRHTLFGDEEGDAVGEHARLARTGARDHDHRTVGCRRGLALDRVEPLEHRVGRDHSRIVRVFGCATR